jgi:hypothetical protein
LRPFVRKTPHRQGLQSQCRVFSHDAGSPYDTSYNTKYSADARSDLFSPKNNSNNSVTISENPIT